MIKFIFIIFSCASLTLVGVLYMYITRKMDNDRNKKHIDKPMVIFNFIHFIYNLHSYSNITIFNVMHKYVVLLWYMYFGKYG